ncbi:hypothetical protein ACTJIJ_08500 [Niabella sp. 22666]|uniref:hypothetical protein n=1 Tax=Niabella sp. 22666 TaxID=3453954 RepID=UPI003F86B223
MKLYLPLLLTIALLTACSKKSNPDCDALWINKMKKQWEMVSSCTPEFKHYLGKGMYQSKIIYYTSISCVACDVMPPQYGVDCAGDSIKINNWNDVKDTRVIATCRDL